MDFLFARAQDCGNDELAISCSPCSPCWALAWSAPILPLYDNTAKVGFGLWHHRAIASGLEAPVRRLPLVVLGLVTLGIQACIFFGPPLASASCPRCLDVSPGLAKTAGSLGIALP